MMSFFALLKARSHSQDVAGQTNIPKGPALQGTEGFFYIWPTPPGYRIKPLCGGDSGAGYRISAEFVGINIFLFPPV